MEVSNTAMKGTEAGRGISVLFTYPPKLQLLQTNVFHFPERCSPGYLYHSATSCISLATVCQMRNKQIQALSYLQSNFQIAVVLKYLPKPEFKQSLSWRHCLLPWALWLYHCLKFQHCEHSVYTSLSWEWIKILEPWPAPTWGGHYPLFFATQSICNLNILVGNLTLAEG